MVLLPYLFSVLACTAFFPALGTASARQIDRKHIQALQQEAVNSFNKNRLAAGPVVGDVRLNAGVKNFTFSNPAASGKCRVARVRVFLGIGWCVNLGLAFYVDGTTIPEVDWDVGPSWAGLLPISGDKNETRKVDAHRSITLHLNAEAPL